MDELQVKWKKLDNNIFQSCMIPFMEIFRKGKSRDRNRLIIAWDWGWEKEMIQMNIKDLFRMIEIFYNWTVEAAANLISIIDQAKNR